MSFSHTQPALPSPILALVCLAIVRRFRPDWVAVPIEDAAASEGVSSERVSRLVTRAIDPFARMLARLTRRGRPPIDAELRHDATELALTQALLEVTCAILARIPLRRRAVGDYVAGAWKRLSAEHGVTQKRFCAALSLSPRTLRSWLAAPPSQHPPSGEALVKPPRSRKPRSRPGRRRFGFDVLLPDTQIAADTTDLSAFGVPLKLIAAQDVGGRDQDLLDSVIVDQRESADHVIDALRKTLNACPGAQAITDQGTPYMAGATRQALDDLEAEHAPQREGDPLGKATIERAFGTVKSLAQPLLGLSNRLAATWPALQQADLAKPTAKLVLALLLRAYQAGARATRTATVERGDVDANSLARLAEQSRERARAHDRSARLLLAHIHEIYDIDGSTAAFVRALRRYPLAVLHQAERDFGTQVHRDDIKKRSAYFAKIVRSHLDGYRREQALRERDTRQRIQEQKEQAAAKRRRADRHSDPIGTLRVAVQMLSAQWDKTRQQLRFGGHGMPRGWIQTAIADLCRDHGFAATRDIVRGVLETHDQRHHQDPQCWHAIEVILDGIFANHQQCTNLTAATSARAAVILQTNNQHRRPPPGLRLRNLAAGAGGT